jgi:hypothetical protein
LTLVALVLGLFGSQSQAGPNVANVRASQRAGTKLVDIYYDLSGGTEPISVSLAASSDAGATYAVPVGSVTGNVGANVPAGMTRKITWNAGADWDQKVSRIMRFKVAATDASSLVAPQLISPNNGAPSFILQPTFSWNAVQGADSYRITIKQGNLVAVNSIVAGTSFKPATNLSPGYFQWCVSARSGENEGPASELRTIHIILFGGGGEF